MQGIRSRRHSYLLAAHADIEQELGDQDQHSAYEDLGTAEPSPAFSPEIRRQENAILRSSQRCPTHIRMFLVGSRTGVTCRPPSMPICSESGWTSWA